MPRFGVDASFNKKQNGLEQSKNDPTSPVHGAAGMNWKCRKRRRQVKNNEHKKSEASPK